MPAPIARRRGYRPSYPEYLESGERAEPDPAALAMISEYGGLIYEA
ncbi:MAG: hypothetical protein KDB48_06550 [Solirubrobacterales bacterium]|nr:hypothetical protein [Solirubrobacterales bacterium]HMT06165.1 hypothetical protein [Solirubrobacterales bacterium]